MKTFLLISIFVASVSAHAGSEAEVAAIANRKSCEFEKAKIDALTEQNRVLVENQRVLSENLRIFTQRDAKAKSPVGFYKMPGTDACYTAVTAGAEPQTILITVVGECKGDTRSYKYKQIDTNLYEHPAGYRSKFNDDSVEVFKIGKDEPVIVEKKEYP